MKTGRNDTCPCGSGKKYKHCCLLHSPDPAARRHDPPGSVDPSPAETQRLVEMLRDGRLAQAEGEARALLRQYPASGGLWKGLSIALRGQGKDALVAHRRAAELLPDDPEAHNDLGVNLLDLGRHDEAAASFVQALRVGSDDAVTHRNLGAALDALGRFDEAAASYRRAIELRPDFQSALLALGTTYRTLQRWDDAVASYERACAIWPDYAAAHNNLGNVLTDLGRFAQAQACFRQALQIRPDFAQAHSNLLLLQHLQPDTSAATKLEEARRFGHMAAARSQRFTAWSGTPEPERRLRVGLVSGDFRHHPVGYFLDAVTAAIHAGHSDGIELIAYSNFPGADDVTARLRARCRSWHVVPELADDSLARRIHDDGIDILLDLAGHSGQNRLPVFAWKPAPVQASWLGYFATTGLEAIDYVIADHWSATPDEAGNFTEQIWHLPESRLCFTAPEPALPVRALPALESGRVTFGCFNNLAKIHDAVLVLWARLLETTPGSRLFLKAGQLAEASERRRLARRLEELGIAAERLILEGPEPRAAYLQAYDRVDISLDPFPYPGGTTTVESLWMGVPVLTLAGDGMLGRQGVSLLMNAGLAEWVATDPDDYLSRAQSHARDLAGLQAVRSGLRQRVLASPLFDAPRFAIHLEDALRGMWRRWCAQRPVPNRTPLN